MNTTKQPATSDIGATRAESREIKKKTKMRVSGKSVFKLKNILTKKSAPRGLTKHT